MAFPADSLGIMPYMNLRERFVPNLANPQLAIQQWRNGTASFPINTDILFRWVEDGLRPVVTAGIHSYCFNIYANGQYGTDNTYVNHYPWVHITPALPNVANLNNIRQYWLLQNFGNIYTVVNRSELLELSSGTHPTLGGLDYTTVSTLANVGIDPGKFNWVTGNSQFRFHSYAYVSSDNTWWVYTRYYTQHEGWIRVIPKVSAGPTTAFNGTACTIYTATVPSSDLPKYSGRTIRENDYYELCFDINSQHASYNDQNNEKVYLFDAILRILPAGQPIYKQFPERTELNSRVAGEKALFEDEFLTASQIEAGTNITLKWRTIAGVLTGYTTDPTKGGNLVIESSGGAGGATRHQGALYPFSNANIYYDETTSIIRFQDEPQDYPDSAVALGIARTTLPIYFDLFHDVANDVGIVKARAANNNLHFSITQLNTVNTYPMDTAGQFNDYTVNHIRLVDTPNLTWNVFGDTMPTLMPDNTTAVRQGVIITPQLNGLYVNWNIRSGNHIYFNSSSNIRQVITADPNFPLPGTQMSTFSVDSTDGVDFWGKNGVVCTLIGAGADRLQVVVDRKLLVTDGRQLPKDTTYIHFDSGLGTKQGSLQFGKTLTDPDVKIYYAGVSDFGTYFQNVPALPVTFEVQNGLRSAGLESGDGIRTVRGMYPRQDGRFASQWLKDYNALDTYRTLSNYAPTNIRPTIEFGFWGWDDANSELNVICSDYNPYSGSDYYTTLFNPIQGGAQGKALRFNWTEGFYYISATVQGIMGMYPGTLPNQQFNPVISQAVHLHLFARPTSNSGGDPLVLDTKILQSFDIMKNYDVVPFIANGVGNNTHALYRQANNSRPWSVQGGGLFWLRGLEEITGLLTLNDGGYNNEFYYQICYIKMNCIKVSNVADIHMPPAIVSQDTNPTSYNYAPQRWHDMNFY